MVYQPGCVPGPCTGKHVHTYQGTRGGIYREGGGRHIHQVGRLGGSLGRGFLSPKEAGRLSGQRFPPFLGKAGRLSGQRFPLFLGRLGSSLGRGFRSSLGRLGASLRRGFRSSLGRLEVLCAEVSPPPRKEGALCAEVSLASLGRKEDSLRRGASSLPRRKRGNSAQRCL